MAVPLRCPNCQDNLGKDVENHIVAHCGECGHTFYNERGYGADNLSEKDAEFIRVHKAKQKKNGIRTGRLINRW